MYEEFDNFLSGDYNQDSWYDDGVDYAQSLLDDFSDDDWKELSKNALNKSFEWQDRLLYCIDNKLIQEELDIIVKYLSTENEDLLVECIDALRSYDNEIGHAYIKAHPEIVVKVKERIDKEGIVVKTMLQSFLKTFEADY